MPSNWVKNFKKIINESQRICILGVGNTQKGDDGAGAFIIKILNSRIKKLKNILLIDGGEMPENFSGAIRKFKPTVTIIIDVCKSGKKPGSIFLVEPEKIQIDDISTHRLPLSMLVKFLEETIPTKVIIIGIEPVNLNFGDSISKEVNRAIEKIVSSLVSILDDWQKEFITE